MEACTSLSSRAILIACRMPVSILTPHTATICRDQAWLITSHARVEHDIEELSSLIHNGIFCKGRRGVSLPA